MSNYENYVYLQTVKFHSHEHEHSVWADGQIKFIESILSYLAPESHILDVGCGDGISLTKLNSLGFNVYGIDLNETKLEIARQNNNNVSLCDMHDLSIFEDEMFDVIISSHSLEHSYAPDIAIEQFNKVLKQDGQLFLVLPFPDTADYAIEAHVGRDILGTSDPTNGIEKLKHLLATKGFSTETCDFDSYREPEVWLRCIKRFPS